MECRPIPGKRVLDHAFFVVAASARQIGALDLTDQEQICPQRSRSRSDLFDGCEILNALETQQ